MSYNPYSYNISSKVCIKCVLKVQISFDVRVVQINVSAVILNSKSKVYLDAIKLKHIGGRLSCSDKKAALLEMSCAYSSK